MLQNTLFHRFPWSQTACSTPELQPRTVFRDRTNGRQNILLKKVASGRWGSNRNENAWRASFQPSPAQSPCLTSQDHRLKSHRKNPRMFATWRSDEVSMTWKRSVRRSKKLRRLQVSSCGPQVAPLGTTSLDFWRVLSGLYIGVLPGHIHKPQKLQPVVPLLLSLPIRLLGTMHLWI